MTFRIAISVTNAIEDSIACEDNNYMLRTMHYIHVHAHSSLASYPGYLPWPVPLQKRAWYIVHTHEQTFQYLSVLQYTYVVSSKMLSQHSISEKYTEEASLVKLFCKNVLLKEEKNHLTTSIAGHLS